MSVGQENQASGSSITDSVRTGSDLDVKMVASDPKSAATPTVSRASQNVLYNLHCVDTDASILIGSSVLSHNNPDP